MYFVLATTKSEGKRAFEQGARDKINKTTNTINKHKTHSCGTSGRRFP